MSRNGYVETEVARAAGKRFPTHASYSHPPATAPIDGPTTGTHHHPLPALNTSLPHPATAVKSRGAKSRAGLIAYPELNPNVAPMSTTSSPTITGASPAGAGELRVSVIAKMTATSSAVPTTWSTTPPGKPVKNGCG